VEESSRSSPSPAPSPERAQEIQQRLLAWFAAHGRDLPWRRTRDPYRVLVSEVMLQQVQVSRAIPFYEAFVARFPTVQTLAAAPIAEVIRIWGDMGRYRRIAFLHRAAQQIVERFGGVVPREIETLKALPGVGPYTAGAVACFAYGQDVGFVDTNVRRVIARLLLGANGDAASDRMIAELAARLVPAGRGWDWNQGLLDFGALHCTARKPKCGSCPVADLCASYPLTDVAPRRASRSRATERFEGSNRYFRGRILAALRDDHAEETNDGIPLTSLGQRVKPGFIEDDMPWLYGVVSSLQKDGLAHVREDGPAYEADSAVAPEIVVRLP
jgi:A/G-specific adenine glycosylase